MNELTRYIDDIVEPTFRDFERNPGSQRHGYLACVAAYHAVDRVPNWRTLRIRQKWRRESLDFYLIDLVCHHFKHVESCIEKWEKREKREGRLTALPMSATIFGAEPTLGGMETRNLVFVVRDAVAFLRHQAAELEALDARPHT